MSAADPCPSIAPEQVRQALRDYVHLQAFLAAWFPNGEPFARIQRYGAVGKPVEWLTIARADIDNMLDALVFAISRLDQDDRRLVQLHYIEGQTPDDAAVTLHRSRRWAYSRLEAIDNQIAGLLNLAFSLSLRRRRAWQVYRRFAHALLRDGEQVF